ASESARDRPQPGRRPPRARRTTHRRSPATRPRATLRRPESAARGAARALRTVFVPVCGLRCANRTPSRAPAQVVELEGADPAEGPHVTRKDDLYTLPTGLPVPVDDGAPRHLVGRSLPAVALPSTTGQHVRLDAAGPGWTVLYCY